MTNIKKTNDDDKKTKNKKQRGLTGEPDGPGGPLVPDSPCKPKTSVIHLPGLGQSLMALFPFDLVLVAE